MYKGEKNMAKEVVLTVAGLKKLEEELGIHLSFHQQQISLEDLNH